MTPIYVRTGVLFRDSITVQTGAGTFTTGLTDGSFTRQLSNNTTGGVATTGITVTEVSAGSNPGVYDILIPASIFSANGNYTLKLYVTADPTYSWTQEYCATQDGTPSGTSTLSFTSSNGDGRVVDGAAVAIADAIVYVTQASTGYLTAYDTNASGDWGPVFLAASAGAFVVTATKGGYIQATGSLAAGVASITGPGTNLTLTAVSTTNTVSAGELWSYARRQANNKPGSQSDMRIKQLVSDALDRLAGAHSWQWYWRRAQININAAYATGTITLTNGSANVVIAGGAWPTWAGSAKIFYNSRLLDIATRVSGTTVTLNDTWNAATVAGASFTVFQDTYDLPVNFFEFGRIMQGQAWPYQPDPISVQAFWENQNAWTFGSQYAWCFSIANGKLLVGPYPNTSTSNMYTLRVRPAMLVTESDIADVDPAWTETLRHLINYYVCLYFGESVAGTKEQCWALYSESLASRISNDKSPTQGATAGGTRNGRAPMWITKTTPYP